MQNMNAFDPNRYDRIFDLRFMLEAFESQKESKVNDDHFIEFLVIFDQGWIIQVSIISLLTST